MSINFFSRIPERAVDQVAQFTGEPQTFGNVCKGYRRQLEKTKTYETTLAQGVCQEVSYTSKRAKDLFDAQKRVKIPFAVSIDDPILKATVENVLHLLYSKKYFGSGKEACSLVLDGFAQIAAPSTYFQIRVGVKCLDKVHNIEGQYNALERTLMLNENTVKCFNQVGIEELEKRMEGTSQAYHGKDHLTKLMSIILHEMTHAVHHATFTSFYDVSDGTLKKELGCDEEGYIKALEEAAARIPQMTAFGGLLYPFTLTNAMLPLFDEPARYTRAYQWPVAFAEFLARIPEMYCKFGSSRSEKEIDESLRWIFPLGNDVFWGFFKQTCEGLRKAPLSEDVLGDLADSPKRLFSALSDFLYEERFFESHRTLQGLRIAEDRIPWVIYRNNDPMLSLQRENYLQKHDLEKTQEKGCHSLQYIEPGRLAFSTKFLETFEALSKKTDTPSQSRRRSMLNHFFQEVDSSFRKDAQSKSNRLRIPQIGGFGVLDYQRVYAKRLFKRIYANYKAPYFQIGLSYKERDLCEMLAGFSRLTWGRHSAPFEHCVHVEVVQQENLKLSSDRMLKEFLGEGCLFYVPRRDYSPYPTLAISAAYLDTFHQLDQEAQKSGRESRALKSHLEQPIYELGKAVERFRKNAPYELVEEYGGRLNQRDYFKTQNSLKPQSLSKFKEKPDFKERA
jgi:hypothetical protein